LATLEAVLSLGLQDAAERIRSHSEEHGNPTWTTSHHGISVEIAKSNNNTAALSQAEASPATGRVPTRQS
jgi:hypothetical protein